MSDGQAGLHNVGGSLCQVGKDHHDRGGGGDRGLDDRGGGDSDYDDDFDDVGDGDDNDDNDDGTAVYQQYGKKLCSVGK